MDHPVVRVLPCLPSSPVGCGDSDTEPGFGGSCVAGKCQAAGVLDTAKVYIYSRDLRSVSHSFIIQAWYTQNLQISIPVTIVAALVVFLILWAIFRGESSFYHCLTLFIFSNTQYCLPRRQTLLSKAHLGGDENCHPKAVHGKKPRENSKSRSTLSTEIR